MRVILGRESCPGDGEAVREGNNGKQGQLLQGSCCSAVDKL